MENTCVFCGKDWNAATRSQPGSYVQGGHWVCYECVPYRMFDSWRINTTEADRYSCAGVIATEPQYIKPSITTIIPNNTTIAGGNIRSSTVYVTDVTFIDCTFLNMDVNRLSEQSNVTFIRCSGAVKLSSTQLVTMTDSDMLLSGSWHNMELTSSISHFLCRSVSGHITLKASTIFLDYMFPSYKVTCDATSIMNCPPPVPCYICKKDVKMGELLTVQDKKVHSRCFNQQYSGTPNKKVQGLISDRLGKFSIELEVNNDYTDDFTSLLLSLMEKDFIRKSDGTVTDELVSPIFRRHADLLACEHLFRQAIPYVNASCRTHIHVNASNRLKVFLQKNTDVFDDLSEYLNNNRREVKHFFGCDFSSLCTPCVTAHDRFHYINVCSHYNTIEYRLAQLVSWQQYERLVTYYREFTRWLHRRCIKFSQYKEGGRLLTDELETLSGEILGYYQEHSR
jgi:hypothetical protein